MSQEPTHRRRGPWAAGAHRQRQGPRGGLDVWRSRPSRT